jgi:cytochrome P450
LPVTIADQASNAIRAMRVIAEDRALQGRLRADPSLIPNFIEEMLRLEGSSKGTHRLALRDTKIGGYDVPAGKKIVISLAAANRDPSRWEDPQELKLDRPRIKEHVGFGRGAHTCAGAPLARAEVRVLIANLLDLTKEITLSEEHHGAPDNRRLSYEASYIIRGLEQLHLTLKPR